MAGVIVAVGLAVGIILVAHPFGHGKLAAAKSVTTPRGTVTALSDRTPSAGSPTPLPSTVAPSPSAPSITQQQAAMSLAALLSQSGNDRQAVSAAFNDVAQCGPSLSQDAQTFQTAVSSHRQLLSKLAKLPGLSALPSAMVQDLSTAWQSSASADGDYAKWAQDQLANGCSVSSQSDPNYMAANAPNQQATSSKTAFAQLWNQLAQTYDLPNYSQSDL